MSKHWTTNQGETEWTFPVRWYDRISSWLCFIVCIFTLMGAVGHTVFPEHYVIAALLYIAGILLFLGSILLEDRARRS